MFYGPSLSRPVGESLTFIYSGTIQVWMNLIGVAAGWLPTRHAPILTTMFGALMQIVIVLQLCIFATTHRLTHLTLALVVGAWLVLPQNYETWLNATNSQWLFGVSTLLVLALPPEHVQRHRVAYPLWLIVCGLAGPPGVIAAPLFALRAIIFRTRPDWLLAGVSIACAVLQFAILLRTGTSSARSFSADPLMLLVPALMQAVIAPLVGVDLTNFLGELLARSPVLMYGVVAMGLGLAVPPAVAGTTADSKIGFLLLAAGIFVSVAQTFLGLEPWRFFSGFFGGRYFIVGSVAVCLVASLGTKAEHISLRMIGYSTLALVVVTGLVGWAIGSYPRAILQGPSWAAQVDACNTDVCALQVWSGSPPFDVAVRRP